MKVLFIGGTGVISSACADLAVRQGIDLYLLNRGQSLDRPAPIGATVLFGDIRDRASAEAALAGHTFDAVVEWIAFTPDQVQADVDLFRGRTGQYVFISSASVYQTPPASLPVTESTLLDNPYWEYSRNKIACEELLVRAYRDEKFPMTIVRPSHTYDATKIPLLGGYTSLQRMKAGKPVVVYGDGTSLWTLTNHRDFAKGFVPLLGNSRAVGEAVHITSDEWLSWNQIYETMAAALGVEADLVHIPSELINAFDPLHGEGLLGDKSHSMIFDNSKIKRLAPGFACTIPFAWGAREIVAWHEAEPARQQVDPYVDALMDRVIAAYRSIWP
ncbi:MAG: NAD-dependent epimerase/dehydratase family protein [Caldilineae bacterium]|nr:NAD-dependent epimerase/dehydratase family protein [Caldilineae bacterium]